MKKKKQNLQIVGVVDLLRLMASAPSCCLAFTSENCEREGNGEKTAYVQCVLTFRKMEMVDEFFLVLKIFTFVRQEIITHNTSKLQLQTPRKLSQFISTVNCSDSEACYV